MEDDSINASFDRLHNDLLGLRSELRSFADAILVRVDTKADAASTNARLDRIEANEHKLYWRITSIAIACALAGTGIGSFIDSLN